MNPIRLVPKLDDIRRKKADICFLIVSAAVKSTVTIGKLNFAAFGIQYEKRRAGSGRAGPAE